MNLGVPNLRVILVNAAIFEIGRGLRLNSAKYSMVEVCWRSGAGSVCAITVSRFAVSRSLSVRGGAGLKHS